MTWHCCKASAEWRQLISTIRKTRTLLGQTSFNFRLKGKVADMYSLSNAPNLLRHFANNSDRACVLLLLKTTGCQGLHFPPEFDIFEAKSGRGIVILTLHSVRCFLQ